MWTEESDKIEIEKRRRKKAKVPVHICPQMKVKTAMNQPLERVHGKKKPVDRLFVICPQVRLNMSL
jgi:hypothetical protein